MAKKVVGLPGNTIRGLDKIRELMRGQIKKQAMIFGRGYYPTLYWLLINLMGGSMESFEERWGKLTVEQIKELNETARRTCEEDS